MAKSFIYTRTGDTGTTALVGGSRVYKDDPRLDAYGTVDELNSWIGMLASSETLTLERRELLRSIQNRLFDVGCALATEEGSTYRPASFPQAAVDELEQAIDAIDAHLPRHNRFILPGGHSHAARAHVARTVARRAERLMVSLDREHPVDPVIMKYVNRLSDLLFVLAREINVNRGEEEIFWEQGN